MRNWFAAGVFVALTLVAHNSARAGTIGTTTVSPNSTLAGTPITVTVTSSITDPSVIAASVNLQKLDPSGRVIAIIGSLHDDGLNGDATAGDKIYSISTVISENTPGTVRLRVSAAFRGSLLRAFSSPLTVNISGSGTESEITILSPSNAAYLSTAPLTVSGRVSDPAARVSINGVSAPVTGGNFVATVPLNEGPNTLTAVATNSNGTTSTTSIQVTLDTTPPRVAIYSPANAGVTTAATATVTGLVNDIVVGTVNPQQATVTVNGVPAEVINRTFTARNIPLAIGANTIQARGVDRAGNGATATITLTRQSLTQTTLRVSSGDGQTGQIRSLLPAPLVAQLLNSSGQPIPNTPVIFRVINQDGTLSQSGNAGTGLSSIAVNTNAQGLATVRFTLGSRAGAGNNLVEASTTGVASTAVFTASATPAAPGLIIVDTGSDQTGVTGQRLPLPFVAVVTDNGYNRLPGTQVTFTVKKGGGSFAGNQTFVTTSDSDGRVMATLTLGPEQGVSNNLVEATFVGNSGFPVAFTASGLTPGPANQTRISGVVLDNSNNPIPGATMRLFQINQGNRGNVPQEVAAAVRTNAQGQFVIQPAPVGVFKLMADGGTAQRPGDWPTLEYDMVTVPGQNNTVGLPIYLPELLTGNRLCVSPTTGGTLTIPQAPGFSLTVAPGSAIFPGGSRTGCLSVTPVNMDKVPMVPGFGQQPRFVVTIQPVGTIFSIPAAITIPNVDGLGPRAVTEMYSFDHDLASFVAIGTATVSEDGSVISSDPGVGVLKAGWHCGGNPNSTGSAASLSVTINPPDNVKGIGKDFSVVANGAPPLDGSYTWEIIATQPGDDPTAATLVQSPACRDQASCTAVVRGVKVGKATLRVHFICSTTGREVTADSRLTIATADVVVVSWVDSSVVTLPSGASSLLTGSLNTPGTCSLMLLDWAVGIPTFLFGSAEVDYANAFLLKNSGNSRPPATIDPDSTLAGGDFRLFNRFQATFTQTGSAISNLTVLKSAAVVGTTPDPCGLVPNASGEAHPSNGANGVTSSGTGVFQLAEGRLGSLGQRVNATINGRTTPWIWSVIRFDASGALTPLDHAIFPTYSVYKDGTLTATFPQSAPSAFISKDARYQRNTSEVP